MESSFPWCTDFYVNQKLALKMDLPATREPVLELFDRIRRHSPALVRLKRSEEEVALESEENGRSFQWVSMRQTSLRSGFVNPAEIGEAYRLHRFLLESAPYFLSISPLDIDHVDLVFGFDFEADGNRNSAVADALLAGSPLGDLLGVAGEEPIDVQPFIGFTLDENGDHAAFVEVRTHQRGAPDLHRNREGRDPISLYLTIRRPGPVARIEDLAGVFGGLCGHAERIAEERVIPHIVTPLRERLRSL